MKKIMLVAVLFTAMFVSCKKESCPTPAYPIEGYWTGLYGSGTTAPSSGYSMVVEAGGKIIVADGATINGSSNAKGTYTIVGNVFKGSYAFSPTNTYSFTATFNSAGKLEAGTWGSGANVSGSGTWFMDRKN